MKAGFMHVCPKVNSWQWLQTGFNHVVCGVPCSLAGVEVESSPNCEAAPVTTPGPDYVLRGHLCAKRLYYPE